MAKRFLKLIENTITKMSNGGFLVGNYVKLASDYKSKDGYKNLPKQTQDYIDSYFDGDNNYKIVNIKTAEVTPGPGNSDNRSMGYVADVAKQTAPGRYDNQGKVTVSVDMLDSVDVEPGNQLGPNVPDSQKYDNKVKIKPEEVDEEDFKNNNNENLSNPRITQQGDSVKGTEVYLPTKNTKIPSKTVSFDNKIGNTSSYMG